jgi:hypothetical protein
MGELDTDGSRAVSIGDLAQQPCADGVTRGVKPPAELLELLVL